MNIVELDAHRQAHFAHFSGLASPHFGVTVNVDITELLDVVRRSPNLNFTPAVVYLITRAALGVESFGWRVRGCGAEDEGAMSVSGGPPLRVVRHGSLRPSWAVPSAASSAFSFCTVPYDPNPAAFHRAALAETERMRLEPSFADEPGADDYLFLSAFPWASFTAVQHAMPLGPDADYVPRIVWGKYFRAGDRTLMPLAVQAHHGLVDGSEMGRYYQLFEHSARSSKEIFEQFSV